MSVDTHKQKKREVTYCIADGVHKPSRLLRSLLERGEQTHEDHDEVGEDDGDGLDLGEAGQQTEV